MNSKRSMAILLVILSLIFGCSKQSKEVAIEVSVLCSENSIDSVRIDCFVLDAAGNQIDTKTFKLKRENKEYWVRHVFNVPRSCQIVLNASGITPENKVYEAVSNKIVTGRVNKEKVYLSLEKRKTVMDNYEQATVKVSGNILSPDYKGLIYVSISTLEDQKKIKYIGDSCPVTAETTVNYSGDSAYYEIAVPVNLGPSIICFFRLGNTEPPYCQDIDIGASDISDINCTR